MTVLSSAVRKQKVEKLALLSGLSLLEQTWARCASSAARCQIVRMMELLRHGKYLGMFKEDPKGTLR